MIKKIESPEKENKAKIVKSAEEQPDEVKESLEITKKEKTRKTKEKIKKEESKKFEAPEKTAELTKEQKEQILVNLREEFARIDIDAEKFVKANKKLPKEVSKGDFKNYKEIKETYLGELKTIREEMFSEISEDDSKSAKERMDEIVKVTIIEEANKLYDQKMDLKLEAKGEPSKIEKMKNFAGKVVEKYRKMPLRKKLLLSAGLMTGGVAAGAVGGATGAALATGLVTGRWLQRTLGGAATAFGLEGLIKRSQEKKIEKETLAELTDKLQESIKNNDKKLDEKLLKLEGSKKKQKYYRYVLAGTMGVLIGSGLVGKALQNVVGGIWSGEEVEKMVTRTEAQVKKPTIIEDFDKAADTPYKFEAPVKGAEVLTEAQAESYIETVKKGDSVWKLAERQLAEHYKEKFTELDEARKTYLIDAIKDKIAADPTKFGLENVDKLKVGQEIDFSKAFEDSDGIFEKADALKQAALENIEKNNKILEEWVKEHPKEQLTSGKVDEILMGEEVTVEAVAEAPISTNEANVIKLVGLEPKDYATIQNQQVGKYLDDFDKEEWKIFGGKKTSHFKLASFIESLKPGEYVKKMTISQFLKKFGGII